MREILENLTVTTTQNSLLDNDPLWFKNAIIYEVPVRAFADSNGDGIGDFKGLTQKLDYIQDLGVTAVWVLPFFPSPLKDDGYDITDYTNVNPIYGTLEDFQEFLSAAHQRGIRVIIELIVNHTSDTHPWFQRARRAPKGSVERDFYVWNDTPDKYREARIIFQDFESSNWAWDPLAKAYYWHRFYSHQPDLNFDNPAVRQAIFEVLDFWLTMGVDGLRLDAVPYLYEREGTNCENLPETHQFLKELRQYIDTKYPNRMLLAEANQWPEDAAQYYGNGDECQMNFHFPLMPRLFMSLRMEDDFPIIDILQQTPPIPENCQWGLFLRNHDELTLEMVTDEDRDFMYRVYAQDSQMRVNLGIRRRLAPLLGNDRRQIELLNSLLLSLPGTPILYYGDEIGMGDNVYLGDRNGVRTPMQWSSDRNAGFSRANSQRLYLPVIVDAEYYYETVNVEVQRANPNSLWYAIKRLIATRKRFQAIGKGSFELLQPENRKVLAFIRSYEDEHILVVANLSRFVQTVELDLANHKGAIPVEIFGRSEFPTIGEFPYFLSLGPYAFYWFSLKPQQSPMVSPIPQDQLPTLSYIGRWQQIFVEGELSDSLEKILSNYLQTCYWFDGKDRKIQSARNHDIISLSNDNTEAQLVGIKLEYIEGEPQTYLLILSHAEGEQAIHLLAEMPQTVVAKLRGKDPDNVEVLYVSMADNNFLTSLLDAIAQNRSFRGVEGLLMTSRTERFSGTEEISQLRPVPLVEEEQRNSCIIYGDRFMLKIFRKLDEGVNPDLEIRRFLSQKQSLQHYAPLAGTLEYRPFGGKKSVTVGILQEYIPHARNGWHYTLDSLRDYLERVMMQQAQLSDVPASPGSLLALQTVEVPELAHQMIGSYLASAELLGQCTGELHVALATDWENPDFAPEPFSTLYQRSIYQSARNLTGQTFRALKRRLWLLPEETQKLAHCVLEGKDRVFESFGALFQQKITTLRLRCHGDYHLRQVLYTGKDFVIIDFEGDPARTLNERRMKRSPLRDVAEMLQSFSYAAEVALSREIESGMISPERLPVMRQWTQFWKCWVSTVFLKSYLVTASQDSFLPKTEQELQVLLDSYFLERVIYNLNYELHNRPQRVEILLQQILNL
ncbi:maltose alpha-D-glucosyltransferase [Gloeothece verrucosa]|uniref:maltose alpha-D-glucosyltransferase n=1 Tax=Gloeothece verrucosa (strain PCC 7822) TaxID=497965 RepID=E0UKF0_GLOV7|nr:maltose alpha-D-glucosyltransferase [Gloeothece verrucosa]ADN17031.1 trehalose synthase [Gloeothece verrucosa PCC 7822]